MGEEREPVKVDRVAARVRRLVIVGVADAYGFRAPNDWDDDEPDDGERES